MKKSILTSLILVLLSINISYSQRFVETLPGNKNGGIKVWNEFSNSDIPEQSYPADTIFGINNRIRLKNTVFSYYSYRKLIALSNEAINNNTSGGTIGVRGLAENKASFSYYNNIFSYGIYGEARGIGTKYGVYGKTGDFQNSPGNHYGVFGIATSENLSAKNTGVYGYALSIGSSAFSYGIYGSGSNSGTPSNGFAGYFEGNVHVNGALSKSSGSFKIDHPTDPENKYLTHSFVESPDMMNIYNGNITTNDKGLATVALPSYFEALNIDFRYQLTVIGKFAQAIVKDEINGSKFVIETDKPNTKVSWQVTGVRNDAYAKKNRIVPEQEKKGTEKGKYLNPEVFDLPKEKSIHFHEAKAPKSK